MRTLILIVALFLATSCDSDTNEVSDYKTEYALAAIEDNMLSTDFTALVEINQASIAENTEHGTPSEGEGVVAVTYVAKVLENYVGNGQKSIAFTEYVDESEGIEDIGHGVSIVSLCLDKNGEYYFPDIGYELPADDTLIEKAREIKALIHDKRLSLRLDEDRYACR